MIGRNLVVKRKVHKDGHEEWDPWKRKYEGSLTLDGYYRYNYRRFHFYTNKSYCLQAISTDDFITVLKHYP